MRFLYKLPLRFRSLLRKSRVEQELREELRFHLERLIEEKIENGMTPEEARYRPHASWVGENRSKRSAATCAA